RELRALPAPLRWSPRDRPATEQVPQTHDAHGEKGRPDPAGRIRALTRHSPRDGPERPVPPGLPAPPPARDGRPRSPPFPDPDRRRARPFPEPLRPAAARRSLTDGDRRL